MGTLAIYGFYLVTRLLLCTACYIFVNDTPALSALPACTSFRWEDSPGGQRDTGRSVGLRGTQGEPALVPALEEFPAQWGRVTGECPHVGKRLYWKDPRCQQSSLPEITEDFLKGQAFPNVLRPISIPVLMLII